MPTVTTDWNGWNFFGLIEIKFQLHDGQLHQIKTVSVFLLQSLPIKLKYSHIQLK